MAQGYIFDTPEVYVNSTGTRAPSKWFGSSAINGAIQPWQGASMGSEYTYIPSSTAAPALFMKVKNGNTSADWVRLSYEQLVSGRPQGLLLILTRS